MAFMPIASRAPLYARLMLALLVDERTPAARKALLAGAAGYLLIGRDLIPDDIPILGGLDDLVVVVLAVDLFLDGVPDELLRREARRARHRPGRLRPGHRPDPAVDAGPGPQDDPADPGAAGQASAAFQQSGVGPRVREWINREERTA